MAKTPKQPEVDEAGPYRNRIVDFRMAVPVGELIANPLNARLHPEHQMGALEESLSEIGWVDVCKVNITTGRMYDGHARAIKAMGHGPETPVPVLYSELTEDEERAVLATLDPIGALATVDPDIFNALTAGLEFGDNLSGVVDDIMAQWSDRYGDGPKGADGILDDHGEHTEDDDEAFWPEIKIKLHPEVKARWDAAMAEMVGASKDSDRVEALLTAAHR